MTVLLFLNGPASRLSKGGYKYQEVYKKYTATSLSYKIMVITDKDKLSKKENGSWHSTIKEGVITRNDDGTYSVEWQNESELVSVYNEGGRGMELSELIYWNGNLLTCDDRSGIVFKIIDSRVVPMHILAQGDGDDSKGFKCEWMTVKDNNLYIGSIGKEWTNSKGEIIDAKPMTYIKRIDIDGRIHHIDWRNVFTSIRNFMSVPHPGYIIHEAVNWNPIDRHWYFLPRRLSASSYDEEADENRGTNVMIMGNENLSDFSSFTIGNLNTTRGYSSFKFIPGREHEIIAVKSVEINGAIESYLSAFDLNTKKVLLEDTYIGEYKYEGVEIL